MGFRPCECVRTKWKQWALAGTLAHCIFFATAFVLAGIAVVVVSVMLLLDSSKYLANEGEDSQMYYSIIYILLGAGSFMAIVGFLGCCGALRESPCMLCTFFVFLVVIIAAEVTGGIWAWSNLDTFEKAVKDQVNHMINKDYSTSEVITKTIDAMQHDLRCCGVDGPQDWANAKMNQKTDVSIPGIQEIGIRTMLGAYSVPKSCCVEMEESTCEAVRHFEGVASIVHGIHSQGCGTALWNGLYNNLVLVCAIGLAIAVLQILGLIFTIVLCCAVRSDGGASFKA
ncbi:CD9 antigen isoform X1 [Ixodes scapularis]|uniref:Tetraspanin n=2 Tax=Ixodes scapularis TaxID=6945 RepID=A0A4D5RKH4_IXOSC|nr:CD9 antigen isoform X1 [Ixodes scapularis]